MITEIIERWEKRKGKLEEYFRTTRQEEYDSYEKIVGLIIDIILNDHSHKKYSNKITVIDDGDYQGTEIFIVHEKTYQPSVDEYIYTSNYYGSCSGCDTLQAIHNYSDGLPNEQQVKDYMMLSLHLIQNFRKMEQN